MRRIPSLDGLRAISILLVICGHLVWRHHGPAWISAYDNTGVRIFFVISGYLITTLLLKEETQTGSISLREFYIRRAYRILPASLFFGICICIFQWHELRWYDMGAIALFLVRIDPSAPWTVWHLWSLGVEEQFYLLWPGILKKWYRQRTAILIAVMIFSPLCTIAGYYFKVQFGGYGILPTVADNLAVGCLLAVYEKRLPKIKSWLAAGFLALIILIPQFPGNTPFKTAAMLLILWPLLHISIAGVILHVIQRPYKFLNYAGVAWIGKISYSLYLWHEPFCSNPVPRPLAYALFMTFLLGIFSYYFVEKPMLRLRERRKVSAQNTGVLCAVPAGD